MAVLTEKLYPPSIEGTIPAFYKNQDGTANLAVPFSMNRAVSKNEVSGISLKIKTVQSNTLTQTLYSINPQEAVDELVAKFIIPVETVKNMMIGQYFKIQIAFVSTAGVGYYSTVGIAKFTAKPTVTIQGMETGVNTFKRTYVGLYQQIGEECDISEKVHSYIFNLYDLHNNLMQSSGWLLHNSSIDTSSNQILALSQSIDSYSFAQTLIPMETYKVEYGVRTINGLEVYSQTYPIMDIEGIRSYLKVNLLAKNNYDNGYIQLSFEPLSPSPISSHGTYVVSRTCADNGFLYWDELYKFYLSSDLSVTTWEYKDFTIEQGKIYQYSVQQYNHNGLYSARILSPKVEACFEDMFLYDGEKQLKIRYNPKVSSIKIDRLEQKLDTIGSKFPFIFRNGNVEYFEFPISGLLSYLSDENEFFIEKGQLGLDYVTEHRITTKEKDFQKEKITKYKNPTTDLVDYNIYAERQFKMSVLQWLGNGEMKLFKSPAEGNFLVRLLNISLAPEDKLSRMLHTFSATAYQVADFTYDNLLSLGFFKTSDVEKSYYAYETVPFFKDNAYQYGKINNYTIAGWMQIQGALPGSYVLRGSDSQPVEQREKIYITNNNILTIDTGTTNQPDIYIPSDDPEQPGLIGSLTYRYITSAVNRFSVIDDISLEDRAETYVGPVEIISSVNGNCKREVYKFHSIQFYRKQIVELYETGSGSNTVYYTDYDNDVFSGAVDVNLLARDKIYKITRPDLNRIRYYYLDYDGTSVNPKFFLIDQGESGINYSVKVNGEMFRVDSGSPQDFIFSDSSYDEVFVYNGVAAICTYTLKLVNYEIEKEDELRQLLVQCNNNVNHPYYLQRLEELLAAIESQEYEGV